jgi:hemolysin D
MFKKQDDSHEFKPILTEIEESPVSPAGRIIYWTIVATFVFTCLWMYFGKVDIVVSARGKVFPQGEVKVIQPLDTGVVSSILVQAGDFVKKGQVLMEINSSTIQPQLSSMQENLQRVRLERGRLAATTGIGSTKGVGGNSEDARTQRSLYASAVGAINSQAAAKKIELQRMSTQIEGLKAEIDHNITLLSVASEKEQRLSKVMDLIAKEDYEQVQNDITRYRAQIDEANFKMQGLQEQKRQTQKEIAYLFADFKEKNLMELSDKQKQTTELEAQIEQTAYVKNKQKITAPVDGYVDNLFINTVGGVVTPAEKLMTITPVNTPLMIKAEVLNKDIGFIKNDLPVSLKIDTFDFQKYGILKGTVKHISKTSIENEKIGPVYEVYITPIDKTVTVEGKKESICSGMSLTAEIKVGKRRVIEFFIYPLIKYMNESINVR